jgi:hypothetical protein
MACTNVATALERPLKGRSRRVSRHAQATSLKTRLNGQDPEQTRAPLRGALAFTEIGKQLWKKLRRQKLLRIC